MKCKIIAFVGSRSDASLTKELIKLLKENSFFECHVIQLKAPDLIESYKITEHYIKLINPDIALCTGDRVEMTGAALCCFLNGVKIAHFYAGITNYPINTFDDINRHAITNWSEIVFCEDDNAAKISANLRRLIEGFSLDPPFTDRDFNNIHVVGMSHLDGLEIDESLVPSRDYDLVLINPTTLKEDNIVFDFDKTDSDFFIVIGPNPDLQFFNKEKHEEIKKIITYDNVPHDQLIGLLKYCKHFIGNSSMIYYECPHYLKPEQIIHVGERNLNRSTPKTPLELGASYKIIEILELWWIKQNE